MRGLPPLPPDVVRVIEWWDVRGDIVTTQFTMLAPGADAATYDQLNGLLDAFFFSPADAQLQVLGNDVSLVQLECVTAPVNGLTARMTPTANNGAIASTTALNAALVWTFRTSDSRRSGHAHQWLPLSTFLLGADKRRLNAFGYGYASGWAETFLARVNALTSPDGASCVLVAVHRQHAGAPLLAATFSPVESAGASPVVGTKRSRTRNAPRSPSVT